MLGGLNSFYLLVDKPEVYGLPPDPKLPSRNLKPSALWSTLGAVALAILGVFSFRERGARDVQHVLHRVASLAMVITAYFFFGGLAGGSYFVATMMHLFAKSPDRRMVRLGYLVAFPLVCLCGLLLTVDLGRPERFWHMLVESETFRPMIKTYSPMSSGAWVLLLFSGCAFLSFPAALAERGRPDWPILRQLDPTARAGWLLTMIGALLGVYLAGYTGVLLSVTNRPIWADTSFLGLIFLVSAASTSAALLILLGSWIGVSPRSVDSLERFDRSVLILEVLALAALIASLGRVATVWLNGWGLLLAAVVLCGIVLPLVLAWRWPVPGRKDG